MATVTFDFTADQLQRACAALGEDMRLQDAQGVARSATQQELKKYMIGSLRALVMNSERRKTEKLISNPEFNPL